MLGVIIVSTTDLFHSSTQKLFSFSFLPLILLVVVLLGPPLMRRNGNGRLARLGKTLHGALLQVRAGLRVFRNPRRGTTAAAQLGAWAIQLSACWALLATLGLPRPCPRRLDLERPAGAGAVDVPGEAQPSAGAAGGGGSGSLRA